MVMKEFELNEIIEKLIGSIEPIGDTNADNERFENLKVMCELTNSLVRKIDDVSYRHKNSHEFSVKRAVEYADNFLSKELGIQE